MSGTYAFLPREAVSYFLMSCNHCKLRIQRSNSILVKHGIPPEYFDSDQEVRIFMMRGMERKEGWKEGGRREKGRGRWRVGEGEGGGEEGNDGGWKEEGGGKEEHELRGEAEKGAIREERWREEGREGGIERERERKIYLNSESNQLYKIAFH